MLGEERIFSVLKLQFVRLTSVSADQKTPHLLILEMFYVSLCRQSIL
jgi:hypothetical protein